MRGILNREGEYVTHSVGEEMAYTIVTGQDIEQGVRRVRCPELGDT
jgi:hypothetical protein